MEASTCTKNKTNTRSTIFVTWLHKTHKSQCTIVYPFSMKFVGAPLHLLLKLEQSSLHSQHNLISHHSQHWHYLDEHIYLRSHIQHRYVLIITSKHCWWSTISYRTKFHQRMKTPSNNIYQSKLSPFQHQDLVLGKSSSCNDLKKFLGFWNQQKQRLPIWIDFRWLWTASLATKG